MKRIISLLVVLTVLCGLSACAAAPVAPAATITATAVEGSQVTLSLSGVPAGIMVVAAYGQGGTRLAAVAAAVVETGDTQTTVDFRRTLPEDCVCKAFVLDADSYHPLLPATPLTLPQQAEPAPEPTPEPEPEPGGSNVLVAYFSCTNHTKGIAEKVALSADADLFQIVPEVPYTAADLNYNTDCRANREQNDPAARPAIRDNVDNWDSYDVVFLGYPIWWRVPPKIMHTFLESYDFSGKTVIPFCTSGSSPYNDAAIKALAAGANWITGLRFATETEQIVIQSWVDGLNLPNKEENTVNKLNVSFNGHTYTATLAENPSVDAFVDYLRSQGGSIVVHAHDYGNFEKVGELGATIVQTNTQINTVPGDLILYQGSNVCLYYSTNSWNFTRLGKLDGDLSNLKSHLGSGDVDITYALAN